MDKKCKYCEKTEDLNDYGLCPECEKGLEDTEIEEVMKHRGYFLTDTGGNCTAYVKEGSSTLKCSMERFEILITVEGDALVPQKLSDAIVVTTRYGNKLESEITLNFSSLRKWLFYMDTK